MRLQTVVRSPGGAAHREVAMEDIAVVDIRPYLVFLTGSGRAVFEAPVITYQTDLASLVLAVLHDEVLPVEFFVPDLWHFAIRFPRQERDEILDMWHLGKDLMSAENLGYARIANRPHPITMFEVGVRYGIVPAE